MGGGGTKQRVRPDAIIDVRPLPAPAAHLEMASPTTFTLRVDHVPSTALRLRGRLGLTRAPGRPGPGRTPDPDAWLREDLDAIVRSGGKVLVTLLERLELTELGDLGGEARRAGLIWIPFPIPDMWIPGDTGATLRLVARLVRRLEHGDGVVVHCWGGLGRAGTIAACVLVLTGVEPGRAIAVVRACRPGAVQTDAQEQFVRDFARRSVAYRRRGT